MTGDMRAHTTRGDMSSLCHRHRGETARSIDARRAMPRPMRRMRHLGKNSSCRPILSKRWKRCRRRLTWPTNPQGCRPRERVQCPRGHGARAAPANSAPLELHVDCSPRAASARLVLNFEIVASLVPTIPRNGSRLLPRRDFDSVSDDRLRPPER
ncbi:hypothetical protein XACM_3832 [Xanthomonas euvesicatoria pv. citrumelo F1]|nr:hypothetical protein XACM_3832 [Xanthomonas euvesicatoria pv. citrumelo F1]